jgi:hypothetical protein
MDESIDNEIDLKIQALASAINDSNRKMDSLIEDLCEGVVETPSDDKTKKNIRSSRSHRNSWI